MALVKASSPLVSNIPKARSALPFQQDLRSEQSETLSEPHSLATSSMSCCGVLFAPGGRSCALGEGFLLCRSLFSLLPRSQISLSRSQISLSWAVIWCMLSGEEGGCLLSVLPCPLPSALCHSGSWRRSRTCSVHR